MKSQTMKRALTVAVGLAAIVLPASASAVALTAPNNTSEPSIVGEAVEGRTLTANRGTWSGSTPMSFAFRWLRCPADGGAAKLYGLPSGQERRFPVPGVAPLAPVPQDHTEAKPFSGTLLGNTH